MSEPLIVSVSPHLRIKTDTVSVMRDVILALLPACVAACILFGLQALLVLVVSAAACVLWELLFEKVTKRPVTVRDGSAIVTGLLLAMCLPVSMPIWQVILGDFVAIVIVKQIFGGIGKNFANPAITGRIVLMLAFTKAATTWTAPVVGPDAVSSATPLAVLHTGSGTLPSLQNMLLGVHPGCLGETCAIELLLGGVYLLIRGVISWHTPVAYLGTVALFSAALGLNVSYQLLSGGLLLGAIFMATDYVTTPPTAWGKLLFGIGCGLLTVIIRQWGSYDEGVSFAILLMNIVTPYLTRLTTPKPLGGLKA